MATRSAPPSARPSSPRAIARGTSSPETTTRPLPGQLALPGSGIPDVPRQVAGVRRAGAWRTEPLPGQEAARTLRRVTRRTYAPRPIPPEVLRVLERGLRQAPRPLRRLYLVMRDAGLRISEALALRADDIDLTPGGAQLRVALGKGHKGRVVPILSARLAPELRHAIAEARKAGDGWIFPGRPIGPEAKASRGRRPWTAAGARKAWHAWLHQLGAPAALDPHQLRHTLATELGRRPGVTPYALAQMFGWAKIETSARYCAPESMRAIVPDLGR